MPLPPPIRSRLQFGPGEGPERYSPTHDNGVMALSGRFLFHHHDLCLFHQSIYRSIEERLQALETFITEHKADLNATYSIDDWEAVGQARLRETISAWTSETSGIRGFADQLLLVGLWAMVEQYCGRTLILAERALRNSSSSTEAPYRWSALQERFSKLGLDLTRCKGYDTINECRLVNNKVKHLGEVDARLASLPGFGSVLGKSLDAVEFPLQRYADAVFEFVGHVMEAVDEILAKSKAAEA